MTFSLNITTAEQKAAYLRANRQADIKALCRAAILAVVGETAQSNIAQAGVIYASMRADGADADTARKAVGFEKGDLQTAAKWKAWVSDMQDECRRSIVEGDDPVWPDVPPGVADMAARF